MDWNAFFEKTRNAAEVDSFAKLAPLIGVTDGAISHYRVGRSVPQVWVIAECLRLQGHSEPEKEAIRIMKNEARTSTERTFYRKLLATTALVTLAYYIAPIGGIEPTRGWAFLAAVPAEWLPAISIMRCYG